MKKISNLKGIKVLSKNKQQEINGGRQVYCGGPRQCCAVFANGATFCDFGYCVGVGNGTCIWA